MRLVDGFSKARELLNRSGATSLFGDAQRQVFIQKNGKEPEQAVSEIILDVRQRGDKALRELTLKFDRAALASLEVSRDEIDASLSCVDAELLGALKVAAERVRVYHQMQKRAIDNAIAVMGGRQLLRSIERVGLYAPGGSACYPSTALMTAIPAREAGVKEVIMATPPGPDGHVPSATLAACQIAGVDRVFSIGGAQAIAALAYGTESVPRVDKICGPGNIFVALAKKRVFGAVAIDGLQGPSEVLIIADETANPAFCAADLLAQAEHDGLAVPVLVTTSRQLAETVQSELEKQAADLPRRDIISRSLGNQGVIVIVDNLREAVTLANLFAAEHLCLQVENPKALLPMIENAGCIFIGQMTTVAIGDYVAGPSHALPTGGTARFSSPLNVLDFVKISDVVSVDRAELGAIGPVAATIARSEGLEAHARSVEKRLAQ